MSAPVGDAGAGVVQQPRGFLMGEPAGTLVVVGVVVLALGMVCKQGLDVLGWYYSDDRPLAFFGSYAALHQFVAMLRGFSSALGWPLVLFGVARMVAIAGAGMARRGRR